MSQLHYPAGYALLTQHLERFGAFRKRWAWIHALAWFVILGPGALLALVLLDGAVRLPWYLLLPLFFIAATLTVYAGVVYGLLPLLRAIEIDKEAVMIESLHGKLDNQIIGSYQLAREVAEAQVTGRAVGYSVTLVGALVSRTADNVGTLNLPALLDRRQAFRDLKIAALIVAGAIALGVFAPKFVMARVTRLHDAYSTFLDLLFPVQIRVTPGDITLVRGKPVSLGVEVDGARRAGVRLIRTDLKSHAAIIDDLTLDHDRATFAIASAQESFTYQFQYGSRPGPLHTIRVGDLPALAAMNTELSFPVYTGLPTRTLVGKLPKLQALAGTVVLVSIASTVDLDPSRSLVTWQSGSPQAKLTVSGRFAHFSFKVDQPERAAIHLTGSLGKGFEMPEPINIEIVPQRDLPPTVDVLIRNKNQTMLAEEATHFLVNAIAEDDFGVAEVSLDYKIDTIDPLLNRPTRQGTIPRLIEPPQDRVKISFPDIFKSLALPLEPGDRITITVSAKDNNTESPSGPGIGRSAPIQIIVVRPDLGAYVEQQFGFGSDPLLGGLRKVKRATNLLIDPERTTHTEAKAPIEKLDVKSKVTPESWPGGSQDAVGDYFRLLSGEK